MNDNKTMTPDEAVERVISLLQSCKGSGGCLGYIERYIYQEDEQAIDIAIQLLKEGEVYMTSKDFDLYLEGYKQGRKDFDHPKSDCENCDFRKFSEKFIDGVVELMNKNDITSIEQLSEILKGGAK